MLYDPTLNRLCATFPACFNRSAPKPLKIGLDEELLARAGVHPALADLTPDQIRQALQCYARRPAYRRALARGGPRYDLDGQPTGEVTPEQQRDASTRWKTTPAPAPPAAPAVDLKALLQEVIALAIAGQMDEAIDGGFRPTKPAAPTFEPKAPTPKAPAPPGSPAMGDATPSLKRRT